MNAMVMILRVWMCFALSLIVGLLLRCGAKQGAKDERI